MIRLAKNKSSCYIKGFGLLDYTILTPFESYFSYCNKDLGVIFKLCSPTITKLFVNLCQVLVKAKELVVRAWTYRKKVLLKLSSVLKLGGLYSTKMIGSSTCIGS